MHLRGEFHYRETLRNLPSRGLQSSGKQRGTMRPCQEGAGAAHRALAAGVVCLLAQLFPNPLLLPEQFTETRALSSPAPPVDMTMRWFSSSKEVSRIIWGLPKVFIFLFLKRRRFGYSLCLEPKAVAAISRPCGKRRKRCKQGSF